MIMGELILGILFFIIISIMLAHISKEKSTEAFKGYIFGVIICGLCIMGTILIVGYFKPQIKPMDVYQGKTTLKYEIVNGEIVDSCVIWKDNKK